MSWRKLKLKIGPFEAEYEIPEKVQENEDFLTLAYNQYRDNRLAYNLWAAELYRRSGYETMADDVPLLIDEGYIEESLRNDKVDKVRLTWNRAPQTTSDGEWFWKMEKDGFRSRVSEEISSDKLRNDYCYRLISSKLTFCPCQYFEYMDSCENIGLKTVSALLEYGINAGKTAKIEDIFPNGRLEPFELTNRYCAVGINTLFILINARDSIMFLHNRHENVEAEHTIHVIPSGTFQPLHERDGFHINDFSLSANILREFGEEFLSDNDLMTPKPYKVVLDERPGLRELKRMYDLGMLKIYYGGFGLDSLTLKPEIMTIAVCNKKDWISFIKKWKNITNTEGEVFQAEFSLESIDQISKDLNLLPAGRGCLSLAKKHYKQLVSESQY